MATSGPLTTTRIIAQRLSEAGCRHAFGIPGGEVLSMMQALDEAGVAFYLCKHENAGGFMAEGTHHATGAPGVLLATIGPGLANGVNSVVNALQDQVPLIVLTGCVGEAEAQTYTHQVFDQNALMRPITKASFTIADGAADVVIDKAVAIAMAAPQGPVHIDIPVHLADQPHPEPRRARVPVEAPMAPAPGPMLDRAREMLARSERPIVIAGVGAVAQGAGPVLQALCERFGAPLLATYKAKGLVSEDHELTLGGHGLSPKSDKIVLPLLEQADCVILAGYDPIEMRTGWRDPWDPATAIEVTHLPNRHGMHGAAMSFVGDVRAGLETLIDGLEPSASPWPDRAPAQVRAALQSAFQGPNTWGPHQAFAAARRSSPRDTVVTADSGAHRILLSQMWPCFGARGMLQSSALCTMGVALPLAMGHKLAAPERPVLAVMGDAGLEMIMGELSTLRDWRMPLAVMVMVDRSLALIELKQRATGRANLGVDFDKTDFAAVADAMGGVGVDIASAAQLEDELPKAYARETFTLLACQIDRKAYDGAF
ncbi:MAG: thiamine pyrophosphate-binding protein [Pseudomonadota bacterium]